MSRGEQETLCEMIASGMPYDAGKAKEMVAQWKAEDELKKEATRKANSWTGMTWGCN